MNPFERWDDWEWEKAAQEVGRERGYRSLRMEPKYPYQVKKPKLDPVKSWTGPQKKAIISAMLFLTVFFASRGEDSLSKGVYAFYKAAMETGNYYHSLTGMAKEAMGLGGVSVKATPVDAKMQGKFLPPVSGRVMAVFGQVDKEKRVHNGIDIGSALGVPVVSPYRGVVTVVGEDLQLGKTVKLDFGDGWTAVLGNLGDISVRQGQIVQAGDVVGTVGLSAPLKKPWLHFELRKNGRPVDPMPYLVTPGQVQG